MILFVSSEDGIGAPSDPSELCSDFYQQKSTVHTQMHLSQILTATFRYTVAVSIPLVTTLYHGNFL